MFPRRITIRRLLTSRMHYLSYGLRAWRQLLSITSSLSTLFCCSSSPGIPHAYRKPSAESTNPDWSLCFFPAHLGDSQKTCTTSGPKKDHIAYPEVEAWPGFEGQRWDYPRCFLAIHRVPFVHGSPSLKLEVLLSKTEQLGPSPPWDMPKWTLFRRPATAVHKSNLRSFPQRHIAWMSNITNTFRCVDRNSIGNPNIIPRNALLSQYENLHCGYSVASHPFHRNAIGTQSTI